MRFGIFTLDEPLPELKEPHALAMLQPWVDVGDVGTLTLSWLESHLGVKELAKLARPGDFFDFTRYRPTMYSLEGRRQFAIPNAYINYGRQKTGNDFLFLHLLEPHSHGEVYVESLMRLLAKLGVKRYCLLGSMYDYVPHTKPVLVTGGGVGKGVEQVLSTLGIEPSNYQGPTTILSLISQRAPEMGIETMSLVAHLPQYTQLEEDYIGTVRLMEVLSSLYGIPLDEDYIKKAEEQMSLINDELEKNPQLKSIIEQLETHYEARSKRKKEEETPKLSPELESFLAEMEKRLRGG